MTSLRAVPILVLQLSSALAFSSFAPMQSRLSSVAPLLLPQRAPPALAKWAGESRAGKLFSADNIPAGVPPWAFGLGLFVLVSSNLGVALLVAVDRIAPGTLPPINAFTEIANAAMERAVASGEVPKAYATFWANGVWLELFRDYADAGVDAQSFVASWCESTAERVEWCTAAKAAAQEAATQR